MMPRSVHGLTAVRLFHLIASYFHYNVARLSHDAIVVKFLRIIFLSLLLAMPCFVHASTPRIVVTIKPLHSIVAAITEDVAKPELLLDAKVSPHHYHLRPTDAQLLEDADVIVWVGPGMERFLEKPIRRQASDKTIITILEYTDSTGNDHHEQSHETNPHVWLDPVYVLQLANRLSTVLGKRYPWAQARISLNTDKLRQKLRSLDANIQERFSNNREVSAISVHHAWTYFERRYGLKSAGAISNHEHHQPGPARLHEIQLMVRDEMIRCLLAEPQYRPRYLKALLRDSRLRVVTADPLGMDIETGPDAYFQLMQHVAGAYEQCLAR